jgi:hypothetical protein
MGFLSGIFGFLGGLGAVAADIFAILEYLFSLIVWVFNTLINGIVFIANFLFGFIVQFGKFFQHLWNSFFKNIFTRTLQLLQKAHDWLEERLRPLINFLKKVRAYYDAIFLRYIKPFLNALQHIRQVLAVLRALHINIGVALDQWISAVEQKIASTFLQFRAVLNNAIDLLNIVADPALLLRKPTLIISLRRILPAIIRAVTGLPPGYFFPSPRGSSSKYFAPVAANFNPSDPAMNPPPSFYLGGNDGIGNVPAFSFVSIPPDSAVDSLDLLDFFDDSLYPAPQCSDAVRCLVPLLQIPRNG